MVHSIEHNDVNVDHSSTLTLNCQSSEKKARWTFKEPLPQTATSSMTHWSHCTWSTVFKIAHLFRQECPACGETVETQHTNVQAIPELQLDRKTQKTRLFLNALTAPPWLLSSGIPGASPADGLAQIYFTRARIIDVPITFFPSD